MGYGIMFRNTKEVCYFRRVIIELIKNKEISSVLLTYPYFYEKKSYDKESIDIYGKTIAIKTEAKYSILDDGLLEAILERENDGFRIGTISSKNNDKYWIESYEKFVLKLNKSINRTSITYIPFWGIGVEGANNKWHSKVAMFFKQNSLIGIMVGSSNMTNRAFEEDISYFNLESDIIIWRDDIIKQSILDIREKIKQDAEEEGLGLIFCISDEKLNKSKNEDFVINEFKEKFLAMRNDKNKSIDNIKLEDLEEVKDIELVNIG